MTKRAETKIHFYIYLFLAVLTLAVYLRVCGNDFVNYDDNDYVTDNPHTLSGLNIDSIKWAFEGKVGYWNPLTFLSHMLDCQLFGVKSWGHHLVNLLIHIANVLILFWIFNAMTGARWRSAFVAVIFAVHPLNVESVAWIAERKNVLSTMFWLLAIGSYWKYSKWLTVKWYLLTLLLFVLGLMSKPMLVTLPFTLLLLDYWPLERLKSLLDWKMVLRLTVEKLPFFVFSAILGIITFWGQKSSGVMVKIGAVPWVIRFENAALSYGKYISKSFWPTKLGVLYPLSDILIWQVIVSAAGMIIVSVFVIRYAGRHKYLLVGWLWYLGTLLPVIGLIQVGSQAMADRYAYVPMIGLLVMVGWGVWELTLRLEQRSIILTISAVSAVVLFSGLTYIQLGYWRNSITLFEHTLIVASDNNVVRCNLGEAYIEKGDYEKAKNSFEEAIRIKPDCAEAYCGIGTIDFRFGRYKEAMGAYKEAIRIKPDFARAHSNVGAVYDALGRYEEAIEAYKEAIRIKPDFVDAYYNLGVTCGKLGRYQDTIEACMQMLKIKPNYAKAYFRLGVTYDRLGRYRDAIEAYKLAVRIHPDYTEAYNNLAIAYGRLGLYQEAIEACKQAIRIKPNYPEAHCSLGNVYNGLGRYQEAIEAYKEAIKIKPDFAEAHFNLGFLYVSMGSKAAAMEEYKILRGLNAPMAGQLLGEINK